MTIPGWGIGQQELRVTQVRGIVDIEEALPRDHNAANVITQKITPQ